MGRQLAVAMNKADEADFLRFLRTTAEVQLYLGRAAGAEQLPTSSFNSDVGEFLIHNRAFPWNPRLKQVSDVYCYYDDADAPIVQYSRHPLRAMNPTISGRIYWSKTFLAPAEALRYDVRAFDRWFISLMRWFRTNGKRHRHGMATAWFLPGAFQEVSTVA